MFNLLLWLVPSAANDIEPFFEISVTKESEKHIELKGRYDEFGESGICLPFSVTLQKPHYLVRSLEVSLGRHGKMTLGVEGREFKAEIDPKLFNTEVPEGWAMRPHQ